MSEVNSIKKIMRADYDQLTLSLEMTEIVRNNLSQDFSKQIVKVNDLLDRSFSISIKKR